ncbi:hypothetical protein Salat_2979800 [Sesamum alatum]|uniref:Uncharacterized protein n=1 Tax=Sesamum alatum TaxID=300844 RepID=A0AAE1XHZ5_9LAMI|nr:hypothetical protein Salat_2979800 [Sesamum alatum]
MAGLKTSEEDHHLYPGHNLTCTRFNNRKLLVVPRGRHPPIIIVSSTERASHRSGERKGPPLLNLTLTSRSIYWYQPGNSLFASYLLYLNPLPTDAANCTGHCAKWPLSQSVNGGTGALGISFLLAVGVINAIELRYSSSRSSLLSELPSLCSGLTFTNSFLSATNFKA